VPAAAGGVEIMPHPLPHTNFAQNKAVPVARFSLEIWALINGRFDPNDRFFLELKSCWIRSLLRFLQI
jgi:hypothetical protein